MSKKSKVLFALAFLALVLYVPASAAQAAVEQPHFVVEAVFWGSEQSPQLASAGDLNLPLSVVLVNEGGPSQDTNLTLQLAEPFYYEFYLNGLRRFSNAENVSLGYVPTGQLATATFYVSLSSSAFRGLYQLPLLVRSEGYNETLQVSVPVQGYSSITVVGVTFTPATLFPNQQMDEMEVYLLNAGTSPAQNATVKLILPRGFSEAWGNSTFHDVGILPVGQQVPVPFFFNVGSLASPGNYTASVEVQWVGGRVVQPVTMVLSGKAKLRLAQSSSTNLTQGGSGQKLYVVVRNVGNYTADDVSLTLEAPNEFSGVMNDYIGELKPGQSATARFEVDTSSGAPAGRYNLTVEISWIQNNTEEPFLSYHQIGVEVHESLLNQIISGVFSQSAAGLALPELFGITIVFLLGVLIGVLVRGRKR